MRDYSCSSDSLIDSKEEVLSSYLSSSGLILFSSYLVSSENEPDLESEDLLLESPSSGLVNNFLKNPEILSFISEKNSSRSLKGEGSF